MVSSGLVDRVDVSHYRLSIHLTTAVIIISMIFWLLKNFTNKKTIVVFWADYWSVCRRELPVLEAELKNLQDDYDVIALAHSEYGPTLEWVNENLNGTLKIGFSTPQLRDYFKVVGQPITLVLDLNGEVILREFGEINFSNF